MQHIQRLLEIMSRLRDPQQGCPWDLKQNYKSLVPYTLEEAYEVAEAIEIGDMDEVKKELGDLLFQVVFYAQLAKEEGLFEFEDIAAAIADKMVSRHPHVFSNHQYENEEAFLKAWEEQKLLEKKQVNAQSKAQQQSHADKPAPDKPTPDKLCSLMDDISPVLPAMTRAVKIQKKATHIGFDWDSAEDVVPIIKQELVEFEQALKNYQQEHNTEVFSVEKKVEEKNRVEEELGDILFSCVNLARKLKLDPEQALRSSNHKFSQRFRKLEKHYQHNKQQMEDASIEQLEQVWQTIKKQNND